MPNESVNYFSDLISPIGVALFTLIFTALYQIYKENQRIRNAKISLLDNLIISLNTAIEKLERLKEDAKTDYFEYENRDTAERISGKLQGLASETDVFTDSKLRRSILENTDVYQSLVEDLSGLELFVGKKNSEFDAQKKNSLDDLRSFKIELAKLGYLFDGKTVSVIDPKASTDVPRQNSQTAEVLQDIYRDINGKYIDSKSELDKASSFAKDRRVHLAIRIVDTQTKLRELNSRLSVSRDKLVSRWF